MSACCVSGCKNRHSSTSKLKFYRIPSGYRPFQANRRRLWLQAIQQVNGGSEQLRGNARICGAHFTSGQASLDHDDPDFVPSVFMCSKTKPSPKKKGKRFYTRRRRRRRKVTVETRGTTAPPEDDSSVDIQSSDLMETESERSEAVQTSPVSKEGEPLTKETEATPSPRKPSLFFKTSAGILKLDKMSPIVLLKPVVARAGGFQCELCTQNFITVLELVKHKQMHDEEKKSFICEICGKHFTGQADFSEHQRVHKDEPAFPCNMCDRVFTTSHNLKRHKLLHVKDGRKCRTCGVLFCRRHNHILFLPQADSVAQSEQDSPIIETQNVDSHLVSENSVQKKCFLKPEPKTNLTPPQAASTSTSIGISVPVVQKPSSAPCPPPPVPCFSRTWSRFKTPMSSQHAAFVQPPPPQHVELPASLQLFSPQYLTSALLEVKRNYEYVLGKPNKVKKEIVKEEQVELPLISPDEQRVKQVKKERIAYDLEIIL